MKSTFASVEILRYRILHVSRHVPSDHQFDFSQSSTLAWTSSYVITWFSTACPQHSDVLGYSLFWSIKNVRLWLACWFALISLQQVKQRKPSVIILSYRLYQLRFNLFRRVPRNPFVQNIGRIATKPYQFKVFYPVLGSRRNFN